MVVISNLVTISVDCQHVQNNIAILGTVNTTNLVTISTAIIFFHHVCHTIVMQTINTITNTNITCRLC